MQINLITAMSDANAQMDECVAGLRKNIRSLMHELVNNEGVILTSLNEMKKTQKKISQGERQEMSLKECESVVKMLVNYQSKMAEHLRLPIGQFLPIKMGNQSYLQSHQNNLLMFKNEIQKIEDETVKHQCNVLLKGLESSVQSFKKEAEVFREDCENFQLRTEECEGEVKKYLDKMQKKHKDLVQEQENALKTPQLSEDVHSGEAEEHKDAEQPSLVAMAASISQPFSTEHASNTGL